MLLGRLKLCYNFQAAVTYITDTVQMSLGVYVKKKKKSLHEISLQKVQKSAPGNT